MSSLKQCLRHLICERLTAAAEDIFTHVERIMVEYEEEVNRQRRLLESVRNPRLKLQRIGHPLKNVLQEEEVLLTEQHLCNQERNQTGVPLLVSEDQEEPESTQINEEEICISQEQHEVKQEADTFMLTPDNEESDHMEPEPDTDHQLLSPVAECQDQTGNKQFTIVVSKEEKDHQCRMMKVLWKPEVKLHQIEVPLKDVLQEEEILTEQQLCNQEGNSSLDQEELDSLQIKEEEEEICISQEQLERKQEADTLMSTRDNEESDHMEPEPDTDHQLLSPVAEGQDQTVHMSNITGEKPYMCNICKKCFVRKATMLIHKRTHTGEKPYVCNVCYKRFAHKDSFLYHMKTHTGEKQFSCETCGKCFRHRRNVMDHRKSHTGERPHVCNICKKCFVRKSNLKKHMTTHRREACEPLQQL